MEEPMRRTLLERCRGPYWFVGEGVEEVRRDPSDLLTYNHIPAPDGDVALVNQTPALAERHIATRRLRGRIIVDAGCFRIAAFGSNTSYVPLWPPNHNASLEDGVLAIVDGGSRVVATVGRAVHLVGGVVTRTDEADLYERLRDELPDACSGPYWLVDAARR